jgi:2-keto-4-pentenoate hydratase/2-oxohepta-3-ene-1,7-dioic acid hydratase in catechol pathway
MRLVTFADTGGARPGLLDGSTVVALPSGAPGGAAGVLHLIEAWDRWEAPLRAALADPSSARVDVESGALLAPLQYPGKLLMAGANYGDHAREMAARTGLPAGGGGGEPFLFVLPTRHTIVGPGDAVLAPAWTDKLDWEVELAVVIGRTARDVPVEAAMDYVFGYTILNDVTSRAANNRTVGPFKHDWLAGKGHDTFCPMGPCIVTKDELPLPVALQLRVNSDLMQDGSSSDLIFSVPELVAYASSRVTLDPGDVISTGTPSGVGAGRGVFLNDGDVMTASIAGIGTLVNAIRRRG